MAIQITIPDELSEYVRGLASLSGTNAQEAVIQLIQFSAICSSEDVQHCMYTGRYVNSIKGSRGMYLSHAGLIIQPQEMNEISNVHRISIKASILHPSPIWYLKRW